MVGLRDRALIGVITYAFARVSAVVAMPVEDYFANGKRWWVRLHEKGNSATRCRCTTSWRYSWASTSRRPPSPEAAGLFRAAIGRTSALGLAVMNRIDAYQMVQRRVAAIRLEVLIGCYAFRTTGITGYLEAGGSLENA